MTSDSLNTESTITTVANPSESNMTMVELTGTAILLPSPPNLKTESASWHSQLRASTSIPLGASAASAPAILSTSSPFDRVNGGMILDDLEQFVLDNTPTGSISMDDDDASTPFIQDSMPRSTITSIPDTTTMLFNMDNNGGGGDTEDEYQDFSFDTEDFIMIDHSYEPVSPPTSPFVLFPPL